MSIDPGRLGPVRRVLFINENLGGHAAMHLYLRRALAHHPDLDATFLDVPRPGLVRRLAALPVPGLARFDADLQPLRYQLAQSALVRRRLPALLTGSDVVHVYTHNAVLLSARALASRPTVVSLDTTNLINAYQLAYRPPGCMTAAALRLVMALERRVYRAATVIVAQSRWTAAPLERYGIDLNEVRIIPFGVTVPAVPTRRPAVGPPRVTFVGTTMERKGGWQLVRACQALGDRCRLTLVTHDHVAPAPGIEVVNDVRPGDPRLASLLADTAVFAFPTEIDKVPYSILEAMAAGVPVISTRVGAIPEMVDDGVTGVLIDPGDEPGLASALDRMLAHEDLRRAMGEAAHRRVLDRFDARKTTAALLTVLAEAEERFEARLRPQVRSVDAEP